MIKCNVTVCGTICKEAQIRTDKEGKPFLAMSISVTIPSKNGESSKLEVSVTRNGATPEELADYPLGSRVEAVGTLLFRKRGDAMYLNLSATGLNTFMSPEVDSIKGDMEFRGTIGKNIEEATDKNGKPYFAFSAYSTEKVSDTFEFTWVRFVYFNQHRPDWTAPKSRISVKGELELSVYKERPDLSCRISEMSQWERQPYSPDHKTE